MVDNGDVILVVEDRDDDVQLLKRALKKTALPQRVEVARQGGGAIAYLAGSPPYDDRGRYPLPVLILLDLKLPGITGYDVLEWMKSRADLNAILVVILSSVAAEASVRRTYRLGANFYFVKPLGPGKYLEILRDIEMHYNALKPARAGVDAPDAR